MLILLTFICARAVTADLSGRTASVIATALYRATSTGATHFCETTASVHATDITATLAAAATFVPFATLAVAAIFELGA